MSDLLFHVGLLRQPAMWLSSLVAFGGFDIDKLNTVNRFKPIVFANCATKYR